MQRRLYFPYRPARVPWNHTIFWKKIHVPRLGLRRLQSVHFLIYRYPSSQACFPSPIRQNRGHHNLIGLCAVYLCHYSFDVSSTFQNTTPKCLPGKGSPTTALYKVLFYYYVFTRILLNKTLVYFVSIIAAIFIVCLKHLFRFRLPWQQA